MFLYYSYKIPIYELKKETTAHISTIYRWIEKYKNMDWSNINTRIEDFNLISNVRRKFYKKKCNDQIIDLVKSYIDKHITVNIKYVIRMIKKKYNVVIKKSSIYKIFSKLGYTHKKVKIKKVSNKSYEEHIKEVNNIKKNINEEIKKGTNILSLDESAFYLNMSEHYGWSKKGEACIKVNLNKIERYSLLLLVSKKGFVKYKIYKGSINGSNFYKFMCDIEMEDGTKILLDNAKIHKTKLMNNYSHKDNLIFNALPLLKGGVQKQILLRWYFQK